MSPGLVALRSLEHLRGISERLGFVTCYNLGPRPLQSQQHCPGLGSPEASDAQRNSVLGPWASVLRPFQAKLLIPTETAELRVPRHVSKQHLKPLPAQMTTRAGPGQTLPKHLMSPDSSEHLLRGLVKTLDLTVPGANEMFFFRLTMALWNAEGSLQAAKTCS